MPVLTVTKHHGLGNDFLVALDQAVDGGLARALCDRHRGIGADGLIGARVDGSSVTMELYNSDGSRAEVSGNGLACLAQAVGRDRIEVSTDAGLRTVTLDLDRATVDMGGATTKEMEGGLFVDMGNPHLVLRDEGQDLVVVGQAHLDLNVELIAPVADGIRMRVHERGVGVTEACGTGACASAVAAHTWGMGGDQVIVHQDGGDAEVDLTGDTIRYTVTVGYIARIEVPCP
jgi:diaminopimelate epimerase